MQPGVVEPVDLAELELEVVGAGPGPFPVVEFGLVEAVHGLRQSVIVTIPDSPDRSLQAGFDEPVGRSVGVAGGCIKTDA